MSPRTSEDELKAPHMLIRASVTAGRNGVRRVRFLLALKYWLKPQIARTALMRTIVGLSAVRPLTVASTNRVIAGFEIRLGNFEPIHRHRPSKNGEARIKSIYFCKTKFLCPCEGNSNIVSSSLKSIFSKFYYYVAQKK